MSSGRPIESFEELTKQFPGIEQQDPVALGLFAFHVATHDAPTGLETPFPRPQEYDAWRTTAEEVLDNVQRWQYSDEAGKPPTLLMALRVVRKERQYGELRTLIPQLQELDADGGMAAVEEFLQRNSYGISTYMARSPLFPEGRTQVRPLDDLRDPKTGAIRLPYEGKVMDKDGNELDEGIESYLREEYPRAKSHEAIDAAMGNLGEFDHGELEELRNQYGSKAANLLYFQSRITQLNETLQQDDHALDITIPPFKAVSVDVYKAWLEGSEEFEALCEAVRADAIATLMDEDGSRVADLVAVRSSALKSEDNEQHSGAGIYDSVTVDPQDREAFRAAIEKVYRSTRGENALAYQEAIGVSEELMGLVIQQYQEKPAGNSFGQFFGHANSTGPNPNLLDLHTQEGILLYDKVWLNTNLLLPDNDRRRDPLRGRVSYLHTIPDHESPLSKADNNGSLRVAHATVVAERLFGRPMQVEFADDAIVQVRPLFVEASAPEVIFPEDKEPIAECAGSGVGDRELKQLDEEEDNSDRSGYVVFDSEYGFSMMNGHAGVQALPKEGAVIILSAASTGHIQTLCQERGLLCFYPKSGSLDEVLEDALYTFGEGGRQLANTTLRLVSDGYEGRIYKSDEETTVD